MILVLNAANKAAFPALMDDMFRARHEVLVERRGWEELRRADGRQVDGFDRADAVYLLALGPARVVAGVRLTGCVGPTFAESLLPELFEDPPPRGEDLLEMTRLFARPEAMLAGGGAPAINAVLTATLEFVRTVGAKGCLMLSRLELVEALLAWGVRPEPDAGRSADGGDVSRHDPRLDGAEVGDGHRPTRAVVVRRTGRRTGGLRGGPGRRSGVAALAAAGVADAVGALGAGADRSGADGRGTLTAPLRASPGGGTVGLSAPA